MKIGFLGDSLTAGYGVGKEFAYPALLSADLAEAGADAEIINAGVSGDTTAGGLRRLEPLLKRRLDWLVIALGANDMLRGIDPKEVEANLRKMILVAQKLGVRIVLLGMKSGDFHGAAYQAAFDAIFPRLSREFSIPFHPLFIEKIVGRMELNQWDGIHPNLRGQEVLAETVFEFLLPILSPESSSRPAFSAGVTRDMLEPQS